tara:strand:- start:3632 stop:3961 length:330 start_codon:yes stop_codon:yes gene_type:complete
MKQMNWLWVCATLVIIIACSSDESEPIGEPAVTPAAVKAPTPSWSFDPEMIFPADGSLNRPEDGEVLSDGRLIVADQVSGLSLRVHICLLRTSTGAASTVSRSLLRRLR